MEPDVQQTLPRAQFKKIIMKLAHVKNNFASRISGTSVAMTEEVQSFSDGDLHYDYYKVLMHRAIDTNKVHTAKQVIKPVVKFATSIISPFNADGLAQLGQGISDLSGFDQDTKGLGVSFRDSVYRNTKKSDRWMAASSCALIHTRLLVKVVHKNQENKIYIFFNDDAKTTGELGMMFDKLVAGEYRMMTPYCYDLNNRKTNLAINQCPIWAKQTNNF